jgi:hypothetical protein
MGEWRYGSAILHLGNTWRCGQLHAPAALPPWKELTVPTKCEGWWEPEPVWTLWSREKSRNPALHPVAIPTEIFPPLYRTKTELN